MAKQLLFDRDVRAALREGVEKISAAVGPSLGPRGRCAVIEKSWGSPTVTKDGSSIADEVELTDPHENMAVQLIREVASKTNDEAGDGTTTATVLAHAIAREGLKAVASGSDAMALSRGIQAAAAKVADRLAEMAKPLDVGDRKRLKQVGRIASGGDDFVGDMLAEAFKVVGQEGAIAVEEGKGIQTEIRIVEGMQFDRGYLSPHFVTDQKSATAVLEKPFILIHEEKLTSARKLVPLLEELAKKKATLLVISEDVEGEALATLVVNKMRGIINVAAVKAPGYGERRKAMLQDISILTSARGIYKDLGIDLEKVTLADLGRAKKVIIDADNTTIIEGAGDSGDVDRRCEQIRKDIETTDSDYDREKLQERLSRLSGGVARINVGASSETEMKERKRRVEDALSSVRAALEAGLVSGGGVAYLQAQSSLDRMKMTGDEKAGVGIVRRAIEEPFRRIVASAGEDPTITRRRMEEKGEKYGFDAENGEICDVVKAGIVDPVKVTRLALMNAASVAGLMLTAEAMISDLPEGKKGPGGAGAPPMM